MTACTDDERREVARRLRGGHDVAGDGHRRFWLSGTLFGMNVTAYSEKQLRDGLSRLADLIDPDCDEGRYSVARTVRPVDREALLALADDLNYAGENVDNVAYIDQTFHESARRIREACDERNGKRGVDE